MSRTNSTSPLTLLPHLGRLARIVLLLLAFTPCSYCIAQSQMRFTRYVAVSHNVGDLRWIPFPEAQEYNLYRRFPGQENFSRIASTPDTHYFDTIHRAICADTVSYYVEAVTPQRSFPSDVVGVYYVDDVPTTPCSVRLNTVDTALNRILLTWYPTPDTDAIGYYICIGSPCVDYDTVWGRLSNSYLCPSELSTDTQYRFRVLAFDSCYQASPLTPSYCNPTISFPDSGCSRRFRCTWNRYINMPDSVGRYRLYYRLGDEPVLHFYETGPDGPFLFDTVIDDLSITKVTAFLSVDNTSDTLHALSQVRTRHFAYGDTAAYIRIAEAVYDPNTPSVALTIDIDSQFSVPECYIYRCQGSADNFLPLATLDRGTPPSRWLHYVDEGINRAAGRYVYRVGIPDLCHNWVKESDTLQLLLPEVHKPTAFFPNVLIYGHPQCGTFCPTYISALSADYRLDIFNRWGQLVYHTTDINDCWNGTSLSGQPLRQGTYVYHARVSHADGTVQSYRGTLTLIR